MEESATICAICQDEITQNELVLECNHKFHSDCIMTWFRSNHENHSKCPSCRGTSQTALHPLDAETRFVELCKLNDRKEHNSQELTKDLRNYRRLVKAVDERKRKRQDQRKELANLRKKPMIKKYLKLLRDSHPKKDLHDCFKLKDREYVIGCTNYEGCAVKAFRRIPRSQAQIPQQLSFSIPLRSLQELQHLGLSS